MREFFKWIGLLVFAFVMIFFNAWCNMVVYNTGIWSLLESLGIYPPTLSFSFFLMLSVVVAYFWKGKTKKTIQLDTTEGWSKVLGLVINKLCYVGLIVLFSIIIF